MIELIICENCGNTCSSEDSHKMKMMIDTWSCEYFQVELEKTE